MDRDAILAAADLPVAEVQVPEWGGSVYVRTLTAGEVRGLDWMADDPNFLGKFTALVLCDQTGARLFSDDDSEALGRKSFAALKKISDAAQEHNGIGRTEAEAGDAVKN